MLTGAGEQIVAQPADGADALRRRRPARDAARTKAARSAARSRSVVMAPQRSTSAMRALYQFMNSDVTQADRQIDAPS